MFGSMVPAWGLLFSFVLYGPSGPNFDSPGGVSQFPTVLFLFEIFFGSPYRFGAQPITLFSTVSAESVPQPKNETRSVRTAVREDQGLASIRGGGHRSRRKNRYFWLLFYDFIVLRFPPICGRLTDPFHPCFSRWIIRTRYRCIRPKSLVLMKIESSRNKILIACWISVLQWSWWRLSPLVIKSSARVEYQSYSGPDEDWVLS